jgi:hypothetical protein
MEVVMIESGRVGLVRRLRAAPLDAAARRVAEACRGHGPLTLLGSEWSPDFRSELADAGVELSATGEAPEATDSLAARCAPGTAALELVPTSRRSEAARRVHRLTHRLCATAAGLVLSAAGLEWWGAARELERVTEARARQRDRVAEALAVRDGLDRWDTRLAALRSAEASGVRWSAVLAGLAEHLPSDAHVTVLRGRADSLILEGEASQATAAFDSLQQTPAFTRFRALAPIRQEARDSGPPVERFVAGAVLRQESDGEGER